MKLELEEAAAEHECDLMVSKGATARSEAMATVFEGGFSGG